MDRSKWPAKADFPIARPGLFYICGAIAVTALLFFMGWILPAIIAFLITLFVCWFFRDPDRNIPEDENVIVSPADGKILLVENLDKNDFTDGPCIKVSIFMNVFNVHVNRIPFTGKIIKTEYFPGKFFNASFDKSSKDNERNALVISTDKAQSSYAVVQIAGLIARRIVCRTGRGDYLKTGDRYGMICFGSRLDIYLPSSTDISVLPGEKVAAGSSIIGYMK